MICDLSIKIDCVFLIWFLNIIIALFCFKLCHGDVKVVIILLDMINCFLIFTNSYMLFLLFFDYWYFINVDVDIDVW